MSDNETISASNLFAISSTMILKKTKITASGHFPRTERLLHIGHAKSICLNFGIAAEYDSTCNLRFGDTNPEKKARICRSH
jgi:glutaminyl-tRNA synthetase